MINAFGLLSLLQLFNVWTQCTRTLNSVSSLLWVKDNTCFPPRILYVYFFLLVQFYRQTLVFDVNQTLHQMSVWSQQNSMDNAEE